MLDTIGMNREAMGSVPKRIVIATIGSLGDLHPCLAIGLELRRRGHNVTIATTEFYRSKVEKVGLGFHAVRPNWNPTDPEIIRECEDLKRGPEILFRTFILPHLRDTYEDLLAAAMDADLMVAAELVYAAPLVAEKLELRWASVILSPCSFFSAYDPSVLVTVPALARLQKAGWAVNRAVINLARVATRHWWQPVRDLRRELGLRTDCDPFMQDKFSPHLVLALFSGCLAEPQRDWPGQTVQPGFVFYDQQGEDAHFSAELADFLAAGDAPIVFTLGSTAVHNPGNFYEASREAARRLGRRAVLLGASASSGAGSADVLELPYAPYAQIFPRAAVIVHQGGSGTTGQAMRAGRPMLFVPYGWDQPDNAARVERVGAGLSVARKAYSATTAAAALNRLLMEPHFAVRAAEVGAGVRQEDGLAASCSAMELILLDSIAIDSA